MTFVISHIWQKTSQTRISCTRLKLTVACAAFCKESRMKFVDSTKSHRKSGDMGRPGPWEGPHYPSTHLGGGELGCVPAAAQGFDELNAGGKLTGGDVGGGALVG
jgi:hypothetical protein